MVATPIQEQLHELHTVLAAALSRTINLRSTIESDIRLVVREYTRSILLRLPTTSYCS